MKYLLKVAAILSLFFVFACSSTDSGRNISDFTIPVNNFSKTVELLISDENFLEDEILKINARNPSVQRIIKR